MYIVKELINFGVDVNLRDEYNILFIKVCDFGYLSVVKELIKVSVNVNFNDEYDILLILVSVL